MKKRILLMACLMLQICLTAKSENNNRGDNDWMLNNKGYVAHISEKNGNLVLSNGLVERVFKNGTTVRMNNLMTGEGMLRSVRPEAEIEIDRVKMPVGGMTGQPIHNYLLEEWLETMVPDSMSLQYAGYEVGDIKPRFAWKPRKEWMTSNPTWPPKGKELVLTYKADDQLLRRLEARFASSDNRQTIVKADFMKSIPAGWSVVTSQSNKENAFENEGKPGEILVPANTCAYAEHALPANTEQIIAKINPGTDQSASWGPGLAWVFDKKTVKTYLRTVDSKFGVTGAGMEYEMLCEGYRAVKEGYLKIQRAGRSVILSDSYDCVNLT